MLVNRYITPSAQLIGNVFITAIIRTLTEVSYRLSKILDPISKKNLLISYKY